VALAWKADQADDGLSIYVGTDDGWHFNLSFLSPRISPGRWAAAPSKIRRWIHPSGSCGELSPLPLAAAIASPPLPPATSTAAARGASTTGEHHAGAAARSSPPLASVTQGLWRPRRPPLGGVQIQIEVPCYDSPAFHPVAAWRTRKSSPVLRRA
jgi:hypothetical protein